MWYTRPVLGFLLNIDAAEAPPWPHVLCAGDEHLAGRGWAWHDDERRRSCFQGEIAAAADLVSRAIDGRELAGVDRLLALVQLREESPGGFVRLFPMHCRACGANHYERARRAIHVVPFIHPAAIERLRAARVPEHLLCKLRYRRAGDAENGRSVKRPCDHGLPIWVNDPDRTLASQLAWARQYALRKERNPMHLDPSPMPPAPFPSPAPAPPPAPWPSPAPSPSGPCRPCQ